MQGSSSTRARSAPAHAYDLGSEPPSDLPERIVRMVARALGLACVRLHAAGEAGLQLVAAHGSAPAGTEALQAQVLAGPGSSVVIEDAAATTELSVFPAAAVVRGFVGARLVGPTGELRGCLCGFDALPRRFGDADLAQFLDFATLAEDALGQEQDARRKRQLQRDLARSRGLYEGIVNTSLEGIVTIDERGLIQSANPAVERIFGHPAADLVGRNVSVLMPQPDRGAHDGYIARYQRDGQPRIINSERMVRGLRASGEQFPMRLSVSEFMVDGARYFTGIIADVSALEHAERKLESSEQLLRAVLDNSDDSIFYKDEMGRYLFANEAFARVVGRPLGQIVGARPESLFAPELAAQMEHYDSRAFSTREPVEYELAVPHAVTGRSRILLFSKTPLLDADGKVLGLVGSAHDITARKAAEEALRVSEARYRGVIEDHPALLCRFLPDSTLTFVNREYAESVGLSPAAMEGVRLRDLLPRRDWERLQQVIGGLGPDSLTASYEQHGWHRGGERWLRWTVRAILDEGAQVVEYQTVGFDVTALHLAQQSAERARAAADRANSAKSAFLSNMSHELRTPLNAILGFAQMLQANRRETLGPHQARCVGHILKSGELLLRLINEILDLSRIEAGALKVEREPVTVHECVRESLELVQQQAAARGIVLSNRVAPVAGVVLADPTRCKQVMLNLLSNAIKYNREGGRVELDCKIEDDMLALSVSDTGAGIPEDKLDGLFQPFNRLGAESSGIEGTGIGLTISLRLLQLMGGNIRVETRAGKGSTFTMLLPRLPDAQGGGADVAAALPVRPQWSGARVVYVEDSATNQALMEMMLEQLGGLQLFLAASGVDGLRLIGQVQPDLVLLDVGLPDMSGLELLAALRRDPRTANIPACAVSALAAPQDVEAGLAAGFDAYLTKPLQFEALAATISRLLQALPR